MCVAIGFKSAVKIQMRRAGRDLSIPLERESERERKREIESELLIKAGIVNKNNLQHKRSVFSRYKPLPPAG